MSKQQVILNALSHIIDPDLKQDIVSLGFVKKIECTDEGSVTFDIELTTPACPIKEQFRKEAEEAVLALDWVKSVDITMTAQSQAPKAHSFPGLAKVATIVAVSSCKGGVGKSTVAVNLAYSIAAMGAKVGLFDADVYGPSLPTMVAVPETKPIMDGDMIRPLEQGGVKLMSFGFVQNETGQEGPAVMRGPMVSQVIQQLLGGTHWGELDYLIIDMPPGTGDIQLTLSQMVPMDAALIVTTPQAISFVDVVKGIQMFDQVQVPTIGVVENMAYFLCDGCDKEHKIFGEGAQRQLNEQFGFNYDFRLPMVPEVAQLCDEGMPIVVELPDSPVSKQFSEIAKSVVREVSRIRFETQTTPTVSYDQDKIQVAVNGVLHERVPRDVRLACRCAHCVDEFSGEVILKPDSITADIKPKSIYPVGNYAVGIDWDDDHHSLYPFELLVPITTA
jgi:Mrp family chromosome partitioning ATPase/DUF971 family protein